MRRAIETLIASALSFLIVFFVNFITDYVNKPAARVTIGERIFINGNLYQPITFENFSDKTLTNLRFDVESGIKRSDLSTDHPLAITFEDELSGNQLKQMIVSDIPSNQIEAAVRLIEQKEA